MQGTLDYFDTEIGWDPKWEYLTDIFAGSLVDVIQRDQFRAIVIAIVIVATFITYTILIN